MKITNQSFLAKLLNKAVFYFDGALSRVYQSNSDQAVTNNKRLATVIVSRKYYTETLKEYPLENKKELKKLLDIEYASKGRIHYIVYPSKEGKSLVNIWQFSDKIPDAHIVLPETLLLAQNLTANAEQIKVLGDLYVARKGQGIVSAYKTGLINSPERFAMSVGLANDIDVVTINENSDGKYTFLNDIPLNGALIKAFSSFFQVEKNKPIFTSLFKIVLPLSCIYLVYMAVTTVVLSLNKQYLQSEYTKQSALVGPILEQQTELDRYLHRRQQLSDFLNRINTTSEFWLVVPSALDIANVSVFRYGKQQYVLMGNAERATTVLDTLNQLEYVKNAAFSSPTRANQGLERFSISFELEPVTSPEVRSDE